ncbi:MAG: type II toxin-antitoxin system VapC family toxin [Alphaproteobacteria bacterium]|nr:type II toxin-antitoxin system VapC family toxin [Alphaproteobacteria bacterium]
MYLLDSNVLLWFRQENEKLPKPALAMLKDPSVPVWYSVITPWELSIKQGKGKLALPEDFFETLPRLGFDCLPVKESHVYALRSLHRLHGDPFDRMLAAQAKTEKLTLVTGDKRLAAYPIKTLLIGS